MKLLFIQDNAINESLAITELSGYLKARGVQTSLLIDAEEKDLIAAARTIGADLIVIPCEVMGEGWCFDVLGRLRRGLGDETHIVVGGTYPTFYPDMVKHDGVRVILRGEAEEAMAEYIARLEAGEDVTTTRNFSFNVDGRIIHNPLRPVMEDLSVVPTPDRELYYKTYPFIGAFSWKKFMSGRGCIHRCTYCYNEGFKAMYEHVSGTFVRQKRAETVVDEVAWMAARYPMTNAHFSDDLFTLNKRWLHEFCDIYASKVTVPFSVNTAVENLDKNVVASLKKAGVRAIALGVETGNEHLRAKILNKKITNDLIRAKAKLVKDAGIVLVTFNMIGIPGETYDDACSTLRLNEEIGADYIRMGFATPIPNTTMANIAIREGLLDAARASDSGEPTGRFGLRRPVFKVADPERLMKLYYLSKLYSVMKVTPLIPHLDKLPLSRVLSLLELMGSYNEKKIFDLGYLNGLRYFTHTGSPNKRTTNYVSII